MNASNKLTLFRIVLTFFFLIILQLPGVSFKCIALILFLLAVFTDFYDGYLARKHHWITTFGTLMDPLADKILICSAFIALVEMQMIAAWIVILIISREFLITGLRVLAASSGKVLAATSSGKHKTGYQVLAITVLLIAAILEEIFQYGSRETQNMIVAIEAGWQWVVWISVGLALLLTLISGFLYLRNNLSIVLEET